MKKKFLVLSALLTLVVSGVCLQSLAPSMMSILRKSMGRL